MILTFFLILIDVWVPLNYLTCEKNGAIEMQHDNNNKVEHVPQSSCLPFPFIFASSPCF